MKPRGPGDDGLQLNYHLKCFDCGQEFSISLVRWERHNLTQSELLLKLNPEVIDCYHTNLAFYVPEPIEVGVMINVFKNKSPDEKRKILKQRSHQDFIKSGVRDKKEAMNQEFNQQAKELLKRKR